MTQRTLKTVPILAVTIAAGFTACATDCRVPAPATRAEPNAARLDADVHWLADDAREGRRAGTDKAKVCAEWIAARLKELGLEPAGEKGYLQEFTVPLDARDGGGSKLSHQEVVYARITLVSTQCADQVAPLFCSDPGAGTTRLEC